MDTNIKKAAMKKARKEGSTLSSLLNFAAREYVNGNLSVSLIDHEIKEAMAAVRRGEYITHEELMRKYKLKGTH